MSQTLTFEAPDLKVKSSWTNSSTGSVSGVSTGSGTATFEVSGIPDGATIDSVTFSCVCGTPLAGGAALLTCNDEALTAGSENSLDFTSTVTGNDSWSFICRYRSNGVENLSAGSHTSYVMITEITLTVVYTGDEPSDDPSGTTETYDYPDSHHICVYAPDEDDFTTNGLGILTPISCVVTEEAGGEYELSLELPITDDSWQNIETESIIKAPVPVITIDEFQMAGAAYWKVKSTQSGVPVKSKVPTVSRVTSTSGYSSWSSSADYVAGNKVAYSNKVWQYVGPPTATYGITTVAPGSSGYWVDVSDYSVKTNYGKTLATLARNEIFTKVADINANWMRVKTSDGVTGYIETRYAEYYADIDSTVASREIRQQCFRVYRIEKDSDTRTVKVSARHLSYDFARTYLAKCQATGVSASTAISLIEGAELYEDNRHIYTDISGSTCDLDCSWDNGVTALLNPDSGIVAQLQAKLIRDNEDFFILADQHTDRGFRIEYGNNMKAVNWTIDTSSMCTRVVPYCKDADDADLMLPEMYVDSDLIGDYPVTYIEPLSVNCKENGAGTVGGEEVEHLTKEQCYTIMREEAQKRFDVDHADEPEVTVDVDLVMLGSTVEYSAIAALEILFMYDTVHIRHPLLDLDITAYMTGYEYDAILRRYNRITLTNARRRLDTSVAGFDLRDNSIRFEKLSSTAVERLRS